LNSITKDEICPIFKAEKEFNVARRKSAPVKVYDYYDTSELYILVKF
jgi:hypothetical protein